VSRASRAGEGKVNDDDLLTPLRKEIRLLYLCACKARGRRQVCVHCWHKSSAASLFKPSSSAATQISALLGTLNPISLHASAQQSSTSGRGESQVPQLKQCHFLDVGVLDVSEPPHVHAFAESAMPCSPPLNVIEALSCRLSVFCGDATAASCSSGV
jgi:hypothetical protein